MTEMGAPWVARKAASAMGYGVGSAKQTIRHSDDKIEIDATNPWGTHTSSFRIDGSEQDTTIPMENAAVKAVVDWEGEALVITSYKLEGKARKELPRQKRYMQGPQMVMERITPKGLVVNFIFDKS